jgi:hypothetical protein
MYSISPMDQAGGAGVSLAKKNKRRNEEEKMTTKKELENELKQTLENFVKYPG